MSLSLNEIEALVRKACYGANCAVGIAEDIARAAAILCASGRDGCAIVLATLRCDWDQPVVSQTPHGRTLRAANPAMAAIAAFDLVGGGVTPALQIERTDPVLLSALARVARTDQHKVFAMSVNGVAFDVTSAPDGPMDVDVALDLSTDGGENGAEGATRAANVDGATWQALLDLAAKTYVPATAESRLLGAGAGLSDND